MKVICAPDSFKETIRAAEAAEAMARGVRRADPGATVDLCPIADGGEGTIDALVPAMRGREVPLSVPGPLGTGIPVEAKLGLSEAGDTAVVELAQAAGLALLSPEHRDPTRTTTYGVGVLIRHAATLGVETIIIGLGGSSTVDGGAGLLQGLGVMFFDRSGREIATCITGGTLKRIAKIDVSMRCSLPRLRVACDVANPLCGREGAAAVYGPQKGATEHDVLALDAGLLHLAGVLGVDPDTPGFGAAGGAAVGLVGVCGATLEPGIELVLEIIGFRDRCRDADLVLTGEGQLDAQSLHGKATMGVARAARVSSVDTIAIVGAKGPGAERCVEPAPGGHLKGTESLEDRYGRARALSEPAACIEAVAADIVRKCMDAHRS